MSTALSTAARADIHHALTGKGFRQLRLERRVPVYGGDVVSGRRRVPIEIFLIDPLMTTPPKVRVTDPAIRREIDAHLETGNYLCYAEHGLEEYDPYDGGGAILRCLVSVRETLDLVLHGNPAGDILREFPAYWDADVRPYIDLPTGFVGRAGIYQRREEMGGGLLVLDKSGRKRWKTRLTDRLINDVAVLQADRQFLLAKGRRPGGTLSSFKRWAEQFVDPSALANALYDGCVRDSVVVIVAPNAAIGVRFRWPAVEAKAFGSAPSARRRAWVERHGDKVEVVRMSCEQIDLATVVDARLATPSPLKALSIAVVGCGAIGSRVASELARSGAGVEKTMLVIDPDTLRPANLGRHALGVNAVGKNKADAMADELRRFHPSLDVTSVPASVLGCLDQIARYDLVVDATGHNPLALRLNAEALERRRRGRPFPPILHAAIHGNGLAVQTILVDDSAHACLKCLRPVHGQVSADPIKKGVQTDLAIADCGDGAHIPYAAAAPTMAAALTMLAVAEWAADPAKPGPRVRSRRLDLERTQTLKDRSWGPDPHCSACGQSAPDV